MNYIDLHVHSNHSDGTLSPSQLVNLAIEKNLRAMALTDHDTISGIPEACAAAKKYPNFELIPGVELSLAYKKRDIHMLGLFIDCSHPPFIRSLENILQERNDRNQKMVNNLKKAGIDITMEALEQESGDAVITRAHFAKYLAAHHYVKDYKTAFQQYLGEDGPYYVPRSYLSPEDGISLILNAGGIPILAHPLLYNFSPDELEQLVKRLSDRGLAGLEALYSSNTGYDESNMKKLAAKYGLLLSGGSDFHGSNKPLLNLGTGKGNLHVPYEVLETLKEYKKRLSNSGL